MAPLIADGKMVNESANPPVINFGKLKSENNKLKLPVKIGGAAQKYIPISSKTYSTEKIEIR